MVIRESFISKCVVLDDYYLFIFVCLFAFLSKIKFKYKLDNNNCVYKVYVGTAFLSKQSLGILSVLLAELQSCKNTGHCSQAVVC